MLKSMEKNKEYILGMVTIGLFGFQVVFIHIILLCQYVLESCFMFISMDQTDVQDQRDL